MKERPLTIGGISTPEYSAFHKALIKNYGRAESCESINCNSSQPKRFEWALKKGHKYSANREDYIQLCPSCHRKYDYNEKTKENMRKSKLGEKSGTAKLTENQVKEIVKLVLSGSSQASVAKAFNIHPSNISDMKRGKKWPHLHYLWDIIAPTNAISALHAISLQKGLSIETIMAVRELNGLWGYKLNGKPESEFFIDFKIDKTRKLKRYEKH